MDVLDPRGDAVPADDRWRAAVRGRCRGPRGGCAESGHWVTPYRSIAMAEPDQPLDHCDHLRDFLRRVRRGAAEAELEAAVRVHAQPLAILQHLHHRLLRAGFSHRRTVVLIYAFTQWLAALVAAAYPDVVRDQIAVTGSRWEICSMELL